MFIGIYDSIDDCNFHHTEIEKGDTVEEVRSKIIGPNFCHGGEVIIAQVIDRYDSTEKWIDSKFGGS